MEEDLKILEDFIEGLKLYNPKTGKDIEPVQFGEGQRYVYKNVYYAIEHLLKAYKEDEAVIEEMAEYIKNPYKVNIISKGRMSRHQAIIEYFRNKVKEEVKDEQG